MIITNMAYTYDYYIASPLWESFGLSDVILIETELTKLNSPFFSPRTKTLDLQNVTDRSLKLLNYRLLFDYDIDNLKLSKSLIANVDKHPETGYRDQGTLFELGYFIADLADTNREFYKHIILYKDDESNTIGNLIQNLPFKYLSPSNSKIILDKNNQNIPFINDNTVEVFVCIDDFNPINLIALGYLYNKEYKVRTYSDNNYQSNVMLAAKIPHVDSPESDVSLFEYSRFDTVAVQ